MDDIERIARLLSSLSELDPDGKIILANDVFHTKMNHIGAILFVNDSTPREALPAWRFFQSDAIAIIEELKEHPLGQDEEPILKMEAPSLADGIEAHVDNWYTQQGLR